MNANLNAYYFTDKLSEFDFIRVTSVDEAVAALNQYKDGAKLMAGGSNLVPALRQRIFAKYPEKVISLKGVKGLKYIKEEAGLKIGALTTFAELADSKAVTGKFGMMADAALKSAPPQFRNLMTIGGDICQELSSWYAWSANPLVRDLDSNYLATEGMNQYLSIFGGADVGYATNVSNMAAVLTALNANVVTNKRTISMESFYSNRKGSTSNTVLAPDELVTEIVVPMPDSKAKQVFQKLTFRKYIDAPLVSVAILATMSGNTIDDARIVLGAVAPYPLRAVGAEKYVKGKMLTEDVAEHAAAEAVAQAQPLSRNGYKVKMAKAIVRRGLLGLL